MLIRTVEEFYCGMCDYITRDSHQIEQIKKTGVCPACQNGKSAVWSKIRGERE